jgi:spore coat protein H
VRGKRSQLAYLIALLPWLGAAGEGPRGDRPGSLPAVPIVDQFDVFSDRAIRTYSLELPEGRWRKLREQALAEAWAAAKLRVDGVPFGVVGVRFKGSTGTLAACFQDGKPVCAKLPMKLRFDRYDPERRFFGLKRLNFHSMLRDPSGMRERLAYRVFEDAGIAAPRTAWARIEVNGQDLGVFTVVEAIDARFVARRFFFDDGLLYKEAWPDSSDPDYYERRLRTHRGEPHEHAKMLCFANELAGAEPDELAALLERWTDADHLMRYMAADRLIGNWDGVTAWYCDQGACANHNFYWYAEKERRRLWLIPWDLDNSFLLFDPLFLARDWLAPPEGCDERPLAWGLYPIRNPSCDRLAAALAALGKERFRPALREVMERAFDPERLRAQILAWRAILAPQVERDANGPRPSAWDAEVSALIASLRRLRDRAEALVRGESTLPLVLEVGGRNDFEAASQASLWRSAQTRSNPRSRVAHGLGLGRALAGKSDLRLDFELRDDSRSPDDRFLQWASLTLPFADGAADLRRIEGLRLLLRADAPRTVRIDVESRRYPSDAAGFRYGWDVTVTAAARRFTLSVRDLALPAWSREEPAPLEEVLAQATSLSFHPQPRGRLSSGFFPPGGSDSGAIRIDDVEFLATARADR